MGNRPGICTCTPEYPDEPACDVHGYFAGATATPAEPARESDGVGLRLSDVENGWVTVLWDRNGRRGRLAEAKRDLERIIAARVAEAGARALMDAAADVYEVGGTSAGVPVWRTDVADWLRDRARGLGGAS